MMKMDETSVVRKYIQYLFGNVGENWNTPHTRLEKDEFVLNPLTPQCMNHIFSRIVLTYTINRSVSTSFSFPYCDLLAVPGQLSPGSTSPQNLVGPPQPVLVLQFDLHQFHGWKHSSNPRDWQRHFLLEMMMVAPTDISHLLKQFCFPFFHPRYSRKLTENSVTVTRKLLSWPQWLDEALRPQADPDAVRCQHVSLGRSPWRRWIFPGHWEQKVRRKSKDMGKMIRLCYVEMLLRISFTPSWSREWPTFCPDRRDTSLPLSHSPGSSPPLTGPRSGCCELRHSWPPPRHGQCQWGPQCLVRISCQCSVVSYRCRCYNWRYCLTYRRIWSDDNKTNIY